MLPNSANIGLNIVGTGQETVRSIADQIRNVQALVSSAVSSAVGNISAVYAAARPQIPQAAGAPVSAAMTAMQSVANSSSATSMEIANAVRTVSAALEALVGPNMAAESSSQAFAAQLANLPPEVGQTASSLRAVIPTLQAASTSIGGLEGMLALLNATMAGQPIPAAAAAAAIGAVAQASVEVPGPAAAAAAGMGGVAQAAGQVAQQARGAATSEELFAAIAGKLNQQVAAQAAQMAALKVQMTDQTNLTRQLAAENSRLSASLERARASSQNVQKATAKQSGSFSTTIKHTYGATRAMDIMSSAMQGAMLTASIFQGQLIGVAMSVYFLRYAILPLFILFAGLALAWYGIIKPIQLFTKNLKEAGKAAQNTLVQFGALAQSAVVGAQMWAASAAWAIKYGLSVDEARKSIVEFWRNGLLNEEMMKASIALSAAWGISLDEATQALLAAVGEEERNVESLKKYGITVDGVTGTTDRMTAATKIAEAVMARFGDVTDAKLKTIAGASARAGAAIRWFWEVFTLPIATNVVAPVINSIATFVAGLAGMIGALWASSEAQGYFNETLGIAKKLTVDYAPELSFLSGVIRSVVVGAFWSLQMALRGVVRVGQIFLGWLKNIRASIQAATGPIKALADMFRILSGAWKGISFSDLLQKAKELLANLPGVLGVLGTLIITLVDAAIIVWKEQAWRLVSDFLLYLLSAKLWKLLFPNTAPITSVLGLLVTDFLGRVFIEAIPNVSDNVKKMLTNVFDFTMWSAAIGPLLLQIIGVIGPKIGLGFLGIFAGLPAWAAIGISVAAGLIIGILDAKLGLGIHDWIVGVIPNSAEDWKNLWGNISSTFNEKVLPFVTTDLPAGLTGIANVIGTWLSNPWDLTPWTNLWEQFKGTVTTALSGPWLTNALSGLKLPSISMPKIELPSLEIPGAGTLASTLSKINEELGKVSGSARGLGEGFINLWSGFASGTWAAISPTITGIGLSISGAWEAIKNFGNSIAKNLAPVLGPLGARLEHIGALFSELGLKISNKVAPILGKIWSILGRVAEFIGKVVGQIAEKFLPILEVFWARVSGILGLVGSLIGGVLSFIINNIVGAFDFLLTLIVEGPKAAFNNFLGFLDSTSRMCQEIVANWVTKIKELFGPLGEWLGGIWGKIKSAALTVWTAVRNVVVGAAQGLVNGVTGIVGKIMGWLSEAWHKISAAATLIWQTIKDKVTGFVQGIYDGIVGIVTSISDWISGAWTTIQTTASTIWGNIKQAIMDVITGLFDWMGLDFGEQQAWFQKTLDDLSLIFSTVWERIKTGITGKATEIKDWITQAFTDVKDFLDGIWKTISTAATTAWTTLSGTATRVWDTVKTNITSAIQGASDWLSTAWENIKKTASTAWDGIKTWADTAWLNIKNAVTGPIQTASDWLKTTWEDIKTKADTAWNGIKGLANTAWQDLRDYIKGPIDEAKTWLSTAWDTIKSTATTAWENIKTAISGVVQGVHDEIVRIIGTIKEKITGVGGFVGDMVQAGKDLIGGIITGVGAMAGDLWRAVENLITEAINKIKEALGLPHSPSPITAKLGNSMVQGIMVPFKKLPDQMAAAINGAISAASRATKIAVPIMLGTSGGGTPGGGAGFAALAATTNGVTILVNVTGNNFSGESGPDQVADAIIEKLNTRLRLRGVAQTGRW